MPIYMDRHDVSETVTAENVAQLHQADLKIQHKFNCRGLTYWFDEKRKTAFCLIEAPNGEKIKEMHNNAHGEVPHRVIEVDANIVESFLGRIEDPEKSQNTDLNIINDPAFRTIMVLRLARNSLYGIEMSTLSSSFHHYSRFINEILKKYNGRIVKQYDDYFLVSYDSVSEAVKCSVDVHDEFEKLTNEKDNIQLKIGLSAGVPVTEKEAIFEDTIKLADRMCHFVKAEIVVSSEVKDLYKSENLNEFIKGVRIFSLSPADEKFLTNLLDFTDKVWRNTDLKVDDFNRHLGYSKSQLYRKLIELTGNSPNSFLKEYRLNKALKLLNKKDNNISEIAFDTGFNSPSYFSKCFLKRYGKLPSEYLNAAYFSN